MVDAHGQCPLLLARRRLEHGETAATQFHTVFRAGIEHDAVPGFQLRSSPNETVFSASTA